MKNVALITGASGGIGLELAKIHAKKGGDLILVARSTNKLGEIAESIEKDHSVEVMVIPKDLSIPDAAEEIFDVTEDQGIQVDILINNAGIGEFGFFHETDWEKEEIMINLNILALTHLTKLYGAKMVNRGAGKVMNLSSTAAFQPGPLMCVYYASKHFVQAFSEALYNEWKDYGVTVTALCPGATASGFQDAADMNESKLVKGKKLPTASEVATYGYKAMMKGEMVAIHGAKNKMMAWASSIVPSGLSMKIVRKMQEKA